MEEVSDEIANLSRKNFSTILRVLADVGQTKVADKLLIHEANISKMKKPGAEFERIAVVLAALGIELPGVNQKLYQEEEVDALRVLAFANLAGIKKPEVSGN